MLINTEPVVNPTMTLNKPMMKNKGDNADANNFIIHKTGTGHFNLSKIGMLRSAAKQPKKVATS